MEAQEAVAESDIAAYIKTVEADVLPLALLEGASQKEQKVPTDLSSRCSKHLPNHHSRTPVLTVDYGSCLILQFVCRLTSRLLSSWRQECRKVL